MCMYKKYYPGYVELREGWEMEVLAHHVTTRSTNTLSLHFHAPSALGKNQLARKSSLVTVGLLADLLSGLEPPALQQVTANGPLSPVVPQLVLQDLPGDRLVYQTS